MMRRLSACRELMLWVVVIRQPVVSMNHWSCHCSTGIDGFRPNLCLSSSYHAILRPTGYDGPWTPTPTTFNNAYFTLLMNLKWVPKEWDGPYQYVDASTGKLMMLPSYVACLFYVFSARGFLSFSHTFLRLFPHIASDLVLLQDKKFLKYVKVYAKDGDKFNKDFTAAFQKLEELGTTGLTPTEWA